MRAIPSAIMPPAKNFSPVTRPAIALLADRVAETRVTSVSAPAGYGKTAAIRSWAEKFSVAGKPVLWIAARSGLHGADTFVAALQAAARQAGMSIDEPTVSPEAVLRALTNDSTIRPILIIEDIQFLCDESTRFLADLIASARDTLTTILSSRGRSRVPLARLRSLGYLLEVGVDSLRFSVEDTAALVTACAERPVEVERINAVHAWMAGWPAGSMMAARLSGRREEQIQLAYQLGEYFEEEVLGEIPAELRNLLEQVAVFPGAFSRRDAVAVTGRSDAGELLESAVNDGLFVQRDGCDVNSFSLQPAFRRVLADQAANRDVSQVTTLQRTAAAHCLAENRLLEALQFAEDSMDQPFLASILELTAEDLTYQGHLMRVVAVGQGLPADLLSQSPSLLLCMAWREIRALSFTTAEGYIAAAEREIDRGEQQGEDIFRLGRLRMLARHRHALLLAARDDMPAVEKASEQLLAELGDNYPYLSCTLLAQLMAARRELFHFQDTLRLEAETRRALARPGSRFASIALKASIAPTLAVQGKTAEARTLLEEALETAISYQGEGSGLAALPALPLAELLYENGQMARARELIDTYGSLARTYGYADQLCATHIVKARLLRHDGDLAGALKVLNEAQLVALECGLERLRIFAVSLQVHFLLRDGQIEEAQRVFFGAGQDPAEEPVPTMNPSRSSESAAVAWIRLEMRQHRLSKARRIAKRWQDLLRRSGSRRSLLTFELLLAEIAVLGGDLTEARRHASAAISLAAEPGWIQAFHDEGEIVVNLLAESYGGSPLTDTLTDHFVAELLKGAEPADRESEEPEDGGGLSDRLAKREIEILALVSAGLRNREIGDRLGLTEGTVKWYMQQIYDKLGVRRRPQAVMRARALSLL